MSTPAKTLYLDFRKYEEALRNQLARLKKIHGPRIFPAFQDGQDLLSLFIETVAPEGLRAAFFFSNTSLKGGLIKLTLRPKIDGPRMQQEFPKGTVLCLRGYPDYPAPIEPALVIDQIVDISDSPARSFEVEAAAVPVTGLHKISPSARTNGILSPAFQSGLPMISQETRVKLDDWRGYLGWRRRIVQSKLAGLRYLGLDLHEGLLRFRCVAESTAAYKAFKRHLKNEDLMAFGTGYSTDPWTFQYNEEHRGDYVELGDFRKDHVAPIPSDVAEHLPWTEPVAVDLFFEPGDDFKNEGPSRRQEGLEGLLEKYPKEGFLAISSAGDFALISRQERILKDLEEQSGFAPFLSSYLFDIRTAPPATSSSPITQWLREDLTEGQKAAVQKMLDAPDIKLTQGPPGTGKTSVIAEACYQFALRGQRVLVASQANLAVDNVLKRLSKNPVVRPVRLTRKKRGSGTRERLSRSAGSFSRERILGHYYESVASDCRGRYLDPWDGLKRRLDAANRWLERADLQAQDLQQFARRLDAVRAEETAAQRERDDETLRLRNAREQNEKTRKLRADLERFRKFLSGASHLEFLLPEEILGLVRAEVIGPLDLLKTVHIDVNPHWNPAGGFSAGERSAFLREILRRWRDVEAALPRIKADLALLQEAPGDRLVSPSTLTELERLEREIAQVERAMIEDPARLAEWQALQKQRKGLLKQSSGLDREVYEVVFNGTIDGRPVHHSLVRGEMGKAEALRILSSAAERLERARASVGKGLKQVESRLEELLRSSIPTPIEETPLRKAEEKLRGVLEKRRDAEETLSSKGVEVAGHLDALRKAGLAADPIPADRFDGTREALRRQIEQDAQAARQQGDFRKAWEPLLRQWVSDLEKPENIESDQAHFLDDYVAACNVVGVTCNESRRTLEEAGLAQFDVAIIDEVSKATPPELLMPMMLARKTILVGDHRQLPPLFKERQEDTWAQAVEEEQSDPNTELTRENFERYERLVTASLFKEHFENAHESLKSGLFVQFRMHPDIMSLVNPFYEHRLTCGLKDADAERHHGMTIPAPDGTDLITPKRHAIWIDTSKDPSGRDHFEQQQRTSKVNLLEIRLIVKMLSRVDAECRRLGYGKGRMKQVGVISFYGQQVSMLKRKLAGSAFEAIQVEVNTVSQFQGDEKPIVLVSLTRNSPVRSKSAKSFVAQFELINVAFSRAQELLVVFGAKDMFYDYPVRLPHLDKPGASVRRVYQDIMDELHRKGCLRPSYAVMDPREYDPASSLHPRPVR